MATKYVDEDEDHLTPLIYLVPGIIGLVVVVFVVMVICCYRYQRGRSSCVSTACLVWCGLGKYAQVPSSPLPTTSSLPEQRRSNSRGEVLRSISSTSTIATRTSTLNFSGTAGENEVFIPQPANGYHANRGIPSQRPSNGRVEEPMTNPFQFSTLRHNSSTSTIATRTSTPSFLGTVGDNDVFLPLTSGNPVIRRILSPLSHNQTEQFNFQLINEHHQRAQTSSESGYGRSSVDEGDTSASEDPDGPYLLQWKRVPHANGGRGPSSSNRGKSCASVREDPDEADLLPMKLLTQPQRGSGGGRQGNASKSCASVSKNPDKGNQQQVNQQRGSSEQASNDRRRNNSGNKLVTDDDGKELEAAITKDTKLPAIPDPQASRSRSEIGNPSPSPTTETEPQAGPRGSAGKESGRPENKYLKRASSLPAASVTAVNAGNNMNVDNASKVPYSEEYISPTSRIGELSSSRNTTTTSPVSTGQHRSTSFTISANNLIVTVNNSQPEFNIANVVDMQVGNRTSNSFSSIESRQNRMESRQNRETNVPDTPEPEVEEPLLPRPLPHHMQNSEVMFIV